LTRENILFYFLIIKKYKKNGKMGENMKIRKEIVNNSKINLKRHN